MPVWVVYVVGLVADVFRADGLRAAQGILATVIAALCLVASIRGYLILPGGTATATFSIALFMCCSFLMNSAPDNYPAEQSRWRQKRRRPTVRMIVGGGIVFCAVSMVTVIVAATSYFTLSIEWIGMILMGVIAASVAAAGFFFLPGVMPRD